MHKNVVFKEIILKSLTLLPLACLICHTAWAQDSGDDYLRQYGVYDIVEQYGGDSSYDTPETYPADTYHQNSQPTADDYLKQYGVYDTVQQYAPPANNHPNTKTINPSNTPQQITQPKTGTVKSNTYRPSTGNVQTTRPSNNIPSTSKGSTRQPSQTGSTPSTRNSVYTGYDDIDAILKENGIDDILSDTSYNTYDYPAPAPTPQIQVYQPETISNTGNKTPSPSGSGTTTRSTNSPVVTQPSVKPAPVVTPTQQVVTAPVAKPTVTVPTVTTPKPVNTGSVSGNNTTGVPSVLASISYSYYAHLNSTQKKYYDAIYEAARKHQSAIPFDGETDDNAMSIAVESVVLDHPEIVWMSGAYSQKMEYDISGSQIALTTIKLEFFPLDFSHYQTFVAEAEKILAEARKLPTPLEKEKYIYDWVVMHTSYNSSTYDQTAYGALIEHQAVCAGYSALFHYLMNRVGIPTYVVNGYANFEDNPGEHAWNIILLNGHYYNVDPTARPIRETNRNGDVILKPYYDYYNKSDRVFREKGYVRDSERGNAITLPTCPD